MPSWIHLTLLNDTFFCYLIHIRYGCKHEAQARKDYEKIMRELHDGYSIADSGLCLNAKLPFMGASPYGIVVYSCHGTGVCEIKVNKALIRSFEVCHVQICEIHVMWLQLSRSRSMIQDGSWTILNLDYNPSLSQGNPCTRSPSQCYKLALNMEQLAIQMI